MPKESLPHQDSPKSRGAKTRWKNPAYRAMMQARRPSEAQIEAIRRSNSTRVVSEETRRKIAEANLRRLENPEFVAKMSGWKHTEDARTKMKDSHAKNWKDHAYKTRVKAAMEAGRRAMHAQRRKTKEEAGSDFYKLEDMLVHRLGLTEGIKKMPKRGRKLSKAAIVIDSLRFSELSLLERKSIMAHLVWVEDKGDSSALIEFLGESKEGVQDLLDVAASSLDILRAYDKSQTLYDTVTFITPDRRPAVVKNTIGRINSLLQEGKTLTQAKAILKSPN